MLIILAAPKVDKGVEIKCLGPPQAILDNQYERCSLQGDYFVIIVK